MIEDELKRFQITIWLGAFVDDLGLLTEDKQDMDVAKETVREIMGRRNFPLDDAKEEFITFDGKRKKVVKYLGFWLDTKLDHKTHISKRLTKATQVWGAVCRIGNSYSGIKPRSYRQIYTGMIRPILLYGFEVINQNRIPWDKIESLEYQAMRKVTGAYHGARKEKVLKIAGVESL